MVVAVSPGMKSHVNETCPTEAARKMRKHIEMEIEHVSGSNGNSNGNSNTMMVIGEHKPSDAVRNARQK